jgi:hypothetical protein
MSIVKKLGLWNILHMATGYSKSYCKKVVESQRNQDAKGAEVIMAKFNDFVAQLDADYAEQLTTEIAQKGAK